jgi:hypothetical protein
MLPALNVEPSLPPSSEPLLELASVPPELEPLMPPSSPLAMLPDPLALEELPLSPLDDPDDPELPPEGTPELLPVEVPLLLLEDPPVPCGEVLEEQPTTTMNAEANVNVIALIAQTPRGGKLRADQR